MPSKKQEQGSTADVLIGKSSTQRSQERVPDVSRPVASKSPGQCTFHIAEYPRWQGVGHMLTLNN